MTTNPPKARITKNSVRIIIDIPDVTDFDWDRAHVLWKDNFRQYNSGTSARHGTNGRILGYFWCKVDPKTNKPISEQIIPTSNWMPMPKGGVIKMSAEVDEMFGELYKKLDHIETTIYRLKTTDDPNVVISSADRSELINDIVAFRSNIATYKEMLLQ